MKIPLDVPLLVADTNISKWIVMDNKKEKPPDFSRGFGSARMLPDC
jgi:hypothetical protein